QSVTDMKDHTQVIDSAVEATCTTTGLTEGKHCAVCKTVLVEQNVVPMKDHTPGNAVKENEIPATCEKEGSCDDVVYCTECKTELSRKNNVIAKTEHSYVSKTIAPICEADGYTVHTCSVCGNSYTDGEVKATGHNDNDGDGYCDNCNKLLNENPSENCSCMCHKTGFVGMIYKLIRIFWKLFKMKQICDCGAVHY
ncbi:MAG: hypothetical protein NC110_04275, partial [Ruminococcus sp.]|nr:hypothetical protein [Ruminococcus sp.]